jgi:hypothetical protein
MAVSGSLQGGVPARFVFEGMAAKLEAFPDEALPPDFNREDPRAYEEQGAGKDVSRPISRKLAIEMGATDDDGPIAVYNEDGAPPCMGKPGDFHAVLRAEGWYEPYMELRRRILGCEPRADERGPAFALRASAPLDGCALRVPGVLSSASFPAKGGKTPPQVGGKLPADLERFAPPEACVAPGCLRAFTLRGVESPAGASLYTLSISQLHPQPNDSGCEVYAEQRCKYTHSLLLVPGPGAAPVPVEVEESDLGAIFLDQRGLRFFVVLNRGGMSVHRVRGGAPPEEIKSVKLYRPHPEDSDFESHSACPYCGP